jgi:hypothetical protein
MRMGEPSGFHRGVASVGWVADTIVHIIKVLMRRAQPAVEG